MAAGRSADTPVLIAVNVSLPTERVIRGKLSSLAFLVLTIGDDDPTMLLIGEAVAPEANLAGAARARESREADGTSRRSSTCPELGEDAGAAVRD